MNTRTVRKWLLIVALFVALLSVTPAFAQEETREPGELATLAVVPTQSVLPGEPVEQTPEAPVDPRPTDDMINDLLEQYASVIPWIVVIVLAAILGLVTIAGVGIVQAARLAPEWVIRGLVSAGDGIMDNVGDYVETTETTVDDYILAELDKRFQELKRELGMASAPASTSGSPPLDPPYRITP